MLHPVKYYLDMYMRPHVVMVQTII